MIKKEKQEGTKTWFMDDDTDIRFRTEEIDENRKVMYILSCGKNLCFTLAVCDFLDHCREYGIHLGGKKSPDDHSGFTYDNEDESLLMTEALIYIDRFDFQDRGYDEFTDEEWYS